MHPATRVSMPAAAVLCVLPGVNVVEGCFPTRDGSRCKPMRRASQHRHLPTSVLWAATWALFVSGAMAADWLGYPNAARSLCDDGNGGHDHGTCLTDGCKEHREYWDDKDCRGNYYNQNGNYAYHVKSSNGKCYGCYRCNEKNIGAGYRADTFGERDQHMCKYSCKQGWYLTSDGQCLACSACPVTCWACGHCDQGNGYWYKNMEDGTTGISGTVGSPTRPCWSCSAGAYMSGGQCASCSPATYRGWDWYPDVHDTGGHTYTTCQTCSAGQQQNSDGSGCTDCQTGQWRSGTSYYGCTAWRTCTGSVEEQTKGTRTSDTVCRCRAGYYRSAGGTGLSTELCTAASAGYYVSLSGQASQTRCLAGSFTTASIICSLCTAGTQQSSGGNSCTNCPTDEWRSGTSHYGCTARRTCTGSVEVQTEGTATSDTVCRCRAGYYRSAGGTGLSTETCTAASVGYYVSLSGQASQTPCPAGSFTDTTASTLCQSGSVCGGTLLTQNVVGSAGCECAAGYYHETPTGLAPTQRCHKCVGGFSEPASTHCSPWSSSAPIPATLTPTCPSTKQLVGTVPAGASDAGVVFPDWTDADGEELTMGTQGSSSLAHLVADVQMYVPMTGSISDKSNEMHAVTDTSKVPKSFARFVAPSTSTGLQPLNPAWPLPAWIYLPFDTDMYFIYSVEHFAYSGLAGNLEPRWWTIAGGW